MARLVSSWAFILVMTLAVSPALAKKEADLTPHQVHLAFAGPVGMTVSWMTQLDTNTSVVKYGLESKSYTDKAAGNSSSYISSFHHHVTLAALRPSTKYYFIAGDEATDTWSQEYSFMSQPPPNQDVPFTVAIYGDMGVSNSEDTMRSLFSTPVDWIFHVGDLGYADDRPFQAEFEKIWDEFMGRMEPVTTTTPYMTCPGNHEAACHSLTTFGCHHGLRNFTAYRTRFKMPASFSGSDAGNMWYSFNYGSVHFVSISTETDYPTGPGPEGPHTLWNSGPFGNQAQWLEADLAAANANRHNQPWIIVVGHRPVYSTSMDDFPFKAKETLQKWLEPLLLKYNVDLYFCGHVHAYERTYPVANNALTAANYTNPPSPVYVVVGNAGNTEGHQKLSPTVPEWVVRRNTVDYGFGTLRVYNSTTLDWTLYKASDKSVADTFTLVKDNFNGRLAF